MFWNYGEWKTCLAISKKVILGLITSVSAFNIERPSIIKTEIIWQGQEPKIRHSTKYLGIS